MLNGGGLFKLRHDVGAAPDNAPKFLNVLRLLDKRKRDPICPEVQSVVEIDPISARELVVLQHLAQGMRLPAIAERLELSERTLETYVTRAQQKLGAKTSTEAGRDRHPSSPDLSLGDNHGWLYPLLWSYGGAANEGRAIIALTRFGQPREADLQHLREFLRGQHFLPDRKGRRRWRSWRAARPWAISCSIRLPIGKALRPGVPRVAKYIAKHHGKLE